MTAALHLPPEPVLASVRIGSPLLLCVQRRASRLGANAPSPLALRIPRPATPPAAASRPARRIRGSTDRSLALPYRNRIRRPPRLASLRSASRSALAASRLRSLPRPSFRPPRHLCRASRPGAPRLRRSRSPEYRHLPTLRPGASHRAECPKPFAAPAALSHGYGLPSYRRHRPAALGATRHRSR